MTLAGMHVKWSVILVGQLGPEILTILKLRFCIICFHLKVFCWFPDLNVLLTRKVPMFLLLLNKISGGRGNTLCVQFWDHCREF